MKGVDAHYLQPLVEVRVRLKTAAGLWMAGGKHQDISICSVVEQVGDAAQLGSGANPPATARRRSCSSRQRRDEFTVGRFPPIFLFPSWGRIPTTNLFLSVLSGNQGQGDTWEPGGAPVDLERRGWAGTGPGKTRGSKRAGGRRQRRVVPGLVDEVTLVGAVNSS